MAVDIINCDHAEQHEKTSRGDDEAVVCFKIGKIKNKEHACHMITSDTWGYKEDITSKNVCIGSLNFSKKK